MYITDQQLPMLLRSVELILAILDGKLSTGLVATSQENLAVTDDQPAVTKTT